MGTYNLNAEEIADAMEGVEGKCEGDFYEETFVEGAKIYLQRLRRMCEECGADKVKCKKLKMHQKKY